MDVRKEDFARTRDHSDVSSDVVKASAILCSIYPLTTLKTIKFPIVAFTFLSKTNLKILIFSKNKKNEHFLGLKNIVLADDVFVVEREVHMLTEEYRELK